MSASLNSRPTSKERKTDKAKQAPQRSLWLRFLDQTNLTVTSLTTCFLLYTRSAGVAYFCAGAVSCSLTVKLLKRTIRQPRPTHLLQQKLTYGMPSTHSATIMYFATYTLFACVNLPLHPSLPNASVLAPLVILPWAGSIALSRVWLGHHTWPQVAVGCSYGIAFASLWFGIWLSGADAYGRFAEGVVNEYFG